MERELTPHVLRDMERKIVLISGARQTGKTTLAKSLAASYEYFNHDEPSHRLILREKSWDRRKPLVIFDELHKMPEWKTFLKAVYDVDGVPPAVVVTGSARLDAFRKVGDSLAGRFSSYRLHPVDVREATVQFEPPDALSRILAIGGFPEPFLVNDPVFYARWKRSHLDVILRQDLLDLVTVTDIASIETLIELLKSRVGSTVSYANLARDLVPRGTSHVREEPGRPRVSGINPDAGIGSTPAWGWQGRGSVHRPGPSPRPGSKIGVQLAGPARDPPGPRRQPGLSRLPVPGT